jgi:phosphatidylserine/phosphatidylglycerophosphate/cardiolipin synthase-like enzyme
MPKITITRQKFQDDSQGRRFADVLRDEKLPFDEVLRFFNSEDRQRRMEEAELHHDRAPLAGVVREFEAQPAIHRFLGAFHPRRSLRLRQAVGVVVRMIMEQRGWKKTGKKGSLGIRAAAQPKAPRHNSGGLALWFLRAERYELPDGMPYPSVRTRSREIKPRTGGNRTKSA